MPRLIALAAAAGVLAAGLPAQALNPQPLPPKEAALLKKGKFLLGQRGIIIVSGKFARVMLNPQPLPPRLAR